MTRTISVDGVMGEPQNALQAPPYYGITDFAAASNGSTILVVTSLGRAALLDGDGTFIGDLTLAGQTDVLNAGLAVGSAGGDYLAAFGSHAGLITQRVSASGEAATPVTHAGTQRGAAVAVASDGANYLVVSAERSVMGQIVSRANAAIGSLQTLAAPFVQGGLELQSVAPSAAWTGSEYVVTFGQRSDRVLSSVSVSASGVAVQQPVAFSSSVPYGEARVAASGGGGAAAWIDRGTMVQFALLDGGSVGERQAISYTAAPQQNPVTARAGNNIVTAWLERRPARDELRIMRAGGEPQLVAPVKGMFFFNHQVVSDGQMVWVVWADDGTMYFRRFTAALEPIDGAAVAFDPFPPGSGHGVSDMFAAEAGASGMLVVFGGDNGLFATALYAEGPHVFVRPLRIPSPDYAFHHPAIVWDGQRYAVVFAHSLETTWWQMPQPVAEEVLLTRISRDGAVLDPEPVTVSNESVKDIAAVRAAVGADGAIGVAWQDSKGDFHLARVEGSTVAPGTVLPARPYFVLGPLVALPNGYALFGHDSSTVQYEHLDHSLVRSSGVTIFPPFSRAYYWDPFYSVESIGSRLYVVYMRTTPEAIYGGVPRLFWRTDPDDTPQRRRAVR
jgi:hypothetical protein